MIMANTMKQIIRENDMGEICGDNRFELIEKYKTKLIEATNIETAKDEMAVIDSILFRFWQMGWLDKLEADVVPKSEEGAECPTCYGTGRIGTTDWLTKNISKKQLAEEKAKAIAEHEQYIKTEYAREIFEEIDKGFAEMYPLFSKVLIINFLAELKKKFVPDTNVGHKTESEGKG